MKLYTFKYLLQGMVYCQNLYDVKGNSIMDIRRAIAEYYERSVSWTYFMGLSFWDVEEQ